jgi:WXG100 family type VII secretion target
MTNFAVDLPTLRQASVRSEAIGAMLRDELSQLHREVDAVLTGSWLGRAADTFDRAFASWEAGARALLDALDELATSVEASAAAYLGSDLAAAGDLVRARQ